MEVFKIRAFAALAASYRDRGFSPVPILAGKKQPGYAGRYGEQVPMSNWSRFCDRPMTPQEIGRIRLADPWAGIGLCMGCGDVVAIDVDDPRAYPVTREILGELCAPVKRGAKGGTAFYHGPGLKTRRFTAKDGQRLVEVLAHGTQTVIPGTVHPDTGEPYRWIKGSLEDVNSAVELPEVTQWHIDQIEYAVGPFMAQKAEVQSVTVPARDPTSVTDRERKRYEGFALAALRSETDVLAYCAKPGRNRALFRATCLLGKYVTHGVLPTNQLVESFKSACQQNGLIRDNGLRDVMRTLEKGLAFSAKDPLPMLAERERFAMRR
jgi:hypothetical protein